MRRIFLACLTCLIATAALALAWVPVFSAFPSGLVSQETLPPEGWIVCEIGGLEYIPEVDEIHQVFTVCGADGWRVKVYCTQTGVPAPESGTGCSMNPDGYYWCGDNVQILKFMDIIEEPTATDTPTPTNTPTDTPTPTPTPTDTSTPTPPVVIVDTDTPTPTPTGTLAQTDTSTPTPTGTITQADPPTVTNTPTSRSDTVIGTVKPPGPTPRPFPGGPGNRSFVILVLAAMAITWGIGMWAFVLRRQTGRS